MPWSMPHQDSDTCFSFLKYFGQFSRHGVGYPSYITNLSDKQASKQKKKKKFLRSKVFFTPLTPPKPPQKFQIQWGGGGGVKHP